MSTTAESRRRVYAIGDRATGVTVLALSENETGDVKVFRISAASLEDVAGKDPAALTEAYATAAQEVWAMLVHNGIDAMGDSVPGRPNVDLKVKEYLAKFRGKKVIDGADFCIGGLISIDIHNDEHASNRRKSYSVLHGLMDQFKTGRTAFPPACTVIPYEMAEESVK